MNCFVCNQVITPKAGGTLVDGGGHPDLDYHLCSLHWVIAAHQILDMAKQHLIDNRAHVEETRKW